MVIKLCDLCDLCGVLIPYARRRYLAFALLFCLFYTPCHILPFLPLFIFFPPYGILKKYAQTAQFNNHAGLRLVCTPHKRAFPCTNPDFKGKSKKAV
nr:MAG TPA: hypothetical protein [Caudoviricetes sp.]